MALLFTLLCGVAAIILGYFFNYFTQEHYLHKTEAMIDQKIKEIASRRGLKTPDTDQSYLYVLLSKNKGRLNIIPESSLPLSEGLVVFKHTKNQRKYAAKLHTFDDGTRLLVGVDISELEADSRVLRWLAFTGIILLLIVIVVSHLISHFVASGTSLIADTARDIVETGDLSRRVEVVSRWDDLSNMSVILNLLLTRIEQLMLDIKQVSDNIAHDLRSPLTRIKNHIEELHKKNPDPDLIELEEEADHILATFNALLKISRIESEKRRAGFRQVHMHRVMCDAIALYEPLAEEKRISLMDNLEEVIINGDRRLLFQTLANLLDNAIKFTPVGGAIKLVLSQTKDRVRVKISDSGPGIPEEEQEKVFDRFYRTERSRGSPGTGLGLSLVAAVVELHQGHVDMKNLDPGLEIVLEFYH